jgi:hypothetical protein
MGLADIIRNAVATVDAITTSLQSTITLYRYTGQGGLGSVRQYASPEEVLAIVEQKQILIKDATGQMVMSSAQVTFPRPISISIMDKIVLQNGYSAPILNTAGLVDSGTGNDYLTELYLG